MLPNAVLSTTPIPGVFLPPRNVARLGPDQGLKDQHYGGVAIGDPSLGIKYQVWTARCDGTDIFLAAPNTPEFRFLAGVGATWVAVAFDQNARVFLAYSTLPGTSYYYWYDSTIPGYRTTTLSGVVKQVFAALDDSRPLELSNSDVILSYTRLGELYFRAQRDRFGVEYDLGPAPGVLAQIGFSTANRFQFAFGGVQGNNDVPPAEWKGMRS